MRLDIDPAGDGGDGGEGDGVSSEDLISGEAAMMTESDSVQPAQSSMSPQAAKNARTLDWRPQHHDQDQSRDLREKAALDPSNASETESGVHPPLAATSSRGLLTPRSTLEMGENIAQCGAMPASDVRDADPAEDYEDGNFCENLVSGEAAVAASSTNDDEDEEEDNDDDDDDDDNNNDYGSEDGSEDGYGSLPMVGKHATRRACQQPGILRKGRRRRRRRQKVRCEEAVRPNSSAHSVTEGQSPPTPSLSKDSSLTNASNDLAYNRRKRDQPGSEEGKDKRTAKRQRTGQEQQASESVATEMGQDQGQSQGRPICLDSPAITTPPAEPSSVHSPPSRSLNASLDADSAKDGDDNRISSGAFISSEAAMVAPGPRGSDVGAHDDDDDVYGAHRQSNSPSQREERGRQQQQDTLERQDIATEVTAEVDGAFRKMDERVKAAEVRQRDAEKEEENIKSKIESEERWQHNLKESIKESVEELRKLQEELKDCQKAKQAAAREAKNESQRKTKMAQEMKDVLRRNGGM